MAVAVARTLCQVHNGALDSTGGAGGGSAGSVRASPSSPFDERMTHPPISAGCRAIEHAIEKSREALHAAENRRVDEGSPFGLVGDESFVLHDPQQSLNGVVGQVFSFGLLLEQMAVDDADTAWPAVPQDLQNL